MSRWPLKTEAIILQIKCYHYRSSSEVSCKELPLACMELFMTDLVGDSTGVCCLTSTFPAEDLRGFGAEVLGGAVIGLV